MCDTLCLATRRGMLFAKSSDRPRGEAQVVERHAPRAVDAGGGATLRTQYLTIPDAPAVGSVLGSRPVWLWGFEHGVNEHRLAVGNEKLYTAADPAAAPPALIGMDLVRLLLERAPDADAALDVLAGLLDAHGQGGNGAEDHADPYFSSFLIVDPRGGWLVETSGASWAARPVGGGAAISNRVSLRTDWIRASPDLLPGTDVDAWRDPAVPTTIADHRLAATTAAVAAGRAGRGDPRDLAAAMRHHGDGPWGRPGDDASGVSPIPTELGDDLRGVTVCMHVPGRPGAVTQASMLCELPAEPEAPLRTWTALGSPCASVYVPGFGLDAAPELADRRTWAGFDALRTHAEGDPDALAAVRAALAPVEAELWDEADALVDAAPDRQRAFTRAAGARALAAVAALAPTLARH